MDLRPEQARVEGGQKALLDGATIRVERALSSGPLSRPEWLCLEKAETHTRLAPSGLGHRKEGEALMPEGGLPYYCRQELQPKKSPGTTVRG